MKTQLNKMKSKENRSGSESRNRSPARKNLNAISNKMAGGNNTPSKVTPFGLPGVWTRCFDDADRLFWKELSGGNVKILFTDKVTAPIWDILQSGLSTSGLKDELIDHVFEVFRRYERLMWRFRPKVSIGEARLIASALSRRPAFLDVSYFGLREVVFPILADCNMHQPGLFEACGVSRTKLLNKVMAMTELEVFSLIHSADAFDFGDKSEESLNKYFNVITVDNANASEDQTHV